VLVVKLSPKALARLRVQHRALVRSRELEFAGTLGYVAEVLPEWKNHPYFVAILWEWYAPLAGDLPRGWYRDIAEDCRKFFANLPWPPRDDEESLPISECRKALGATSAHLRDDEVRFIRDQLYVLGELIVDGVRNRAR